MRLDDVRVGVAPAEGADVGTAEEVADDAGRDAAAAGDVLASGSLVGAPGGDAGEEQPTQAAATAAMTPRRIGRTPGV